METHPGGRGHRVSGAVVDEVICTEAEGNNCVLHYDIHDILVVYWGGVNSRVQSES